MSKAAKKLRKEMRLMRGEFEGECAHGHTADEQCGPCRTGVPMRTEDDENEDDPLTDALHDDDALDRWMQLQEERHPGTLYDLEEAARLRRQIPN